MRITNHQLDGMRRLGMAVVGEFARTWTEGGEEQWKLDRERFLSGEPMTWFWFVLAERIDLYERFRKQYAEFRSFDDWKASRRNKSEKIETIAYSTITHWIYKRKTQGANIYPDDPDLLRIASRVRERFYIVVERRSGCVKSIYRSAELCKRRLKITRWQWDRNSHPEFDIVKFGK